jgi:mono/diheme cytochrome c family protein
MQVLKTIKNFRMFKKLILASTLCLLGIVLFEGCYYDKADQQYPNVGCDTAVVRYSVEIKSILDANCSSCHEGDGSISGINLYDYSTISGLALDGQYVYGSLLSAVLHEGGNPNPMPQGGSKLPDCELNKFRAWVNSGAPNN